jgi:hypothetical protein
MPSLLLGNLIAYFATLVVTHIAWPSRQCPPKLPMQTARLFMTSPPRPSLRSVPCHVFADLRLSSKMPTQIAKSIHIQTARSVLRRVSASLGRPLTRQRHTVCCLPFAESYPQLHSSAHHCQRLPSSLLIGNAPEHTPQPQHPAPRHFRSRLTTIRPGARGSMSELAMWHESRHIPDFAGCPSPHRTLGSLLIRKAHGSRPSETPG